MSEPQPDASVGEPLSAVLARGVPVRWHGPYEKGQFTMSLYNEEGSRVDLERCPATSDEVYIFGGGVTELVLYVRDGRVQRIFYGGT